MPANDLVGKANDPNEGYMRELARARALVGNGYRREALEIANRLADTDVPHPNWYDALGALFAYCDEPARALAFFERAVASTPQHARFLYNLATAQRMMGALAAAEATLDRVIALDPTDAAAYYMRSDLRRQSAEDNHVEEMTRALDRHIRAPQGRIMMRFAIAKELDDLARYEEAFVHLKEGCEQQRGSFIYDVQDDLSLVDRLIDSYNHAVTASAAGFPSRECIFVFGLPRTGTTLVEQILSGDEQVFGAGELPTFQAEAIRAVRRIAPNRALRKHDFVDLSLSVDSAELGRAYLESTRPQTGRTPYFVDKQPLNYLYAALIRRALPQARLVAIARDPLDACFAMYRTLFRGGYPFSYDLGELAAYYAAWHRLMRHWRSVLGDGLLILQYEDIVYDPETSARRLFAHCGLTWNRRCLDLEARARSVGTASATQVRQPIYRSSVGKWRNYRQFLAPLVAALDAREPAQGWRV